MTRIPRTVVAALVAFLCLAPSTVPAASAGSPASAVPVDPAASADAAAPAVPADEPPAAPAPAPTPTATSASGSAVAAGEDGENEALRLLLEKGVITQAEYDEAVAAEKARAKAERKRPIRPTG